MSFKWLLTFLRITLLHIGPSKMKKLHPFEMSATPHWMTLCNFPKTWILKNNSARTSNLASLLYFYLTHSVFNLNIKILKCSYLSQLSMKYVTWSAVTVLWCAMSQWLASTRTGMCAGTLGNSRCT
jgi:hypothetical protein